MDLGGTIFGENGTLAALRRPPSSWRTLKQDVKSQSVELHDEDVPVSNNSVDTWGRDRSAIFRGPHCTHCIKIV